MGYQHIVIVGNVGRDPEFKYTPQGVAVCSFSVAVSKVTGRGEDKKETTTWFRVTLWRERAETASQLIKKGRRVLIAGEVTVRAYLDKNNQAQATLELTGNEFQMMDSRAESEGGGGGGRPQGTGGSGGSTEHPEEPSDLPF